MYILLTKTANKISNVGNENKKNSTPQRLRFYPSASDSASSRRHCALYKLNLLTYLVGRYTVTDLWVLFYLTQK